MTATTRLADRAATTISVLLANMATEDCNRAILDLTNRNIPLRETEDRLAERARKEGRPTNLSCFVVIGPGEWAKADTLHEAIAAVNKRLSPRRKLTDNLRPLHVFASDADLDVEVDDRVRVFAKQDATLTFFIINA